MLGEAEWTSGLFCAVLALVLGLGGCETARPAAAGVPAHQIEAMLEKKQEALALFEEALSLEGQPEEQEKLYLKALSLNPSLGKAYNNLGLVYLSRENYGEAIRLFREAGTRMPTNPVPRFNLGYAYEIIGRLGNAQEQYEAAVSLAPDEPDYLESLARTYIRRRDRAGEARDLLQDALRFETRPEHITWITAQLDALEKGFIP